MYLGNLMPPEQYTPRDYAVQNNLLPQLQSDARLARLQPAQMPAAPGPGLGGFHPGMNPEMGGGRMNAPMVPQMAAQQLGPAMPPPPATPMQRPNPPPQMGAGLGGLGGPGGMDKLAMMLMGAGSAMGQASAPSPYKTGIGTAMGAGMGGAMSGMMGYQAMEEEKKRQAMYDRILASQTKALV